MIYAYSLMDSMTESPSVRFNYISATIGALAKKFLNYRKCLMSMLLPRRLIARYIYYHSFTRQIKSNKIIKSLRQPAGLCKFLNEKI